jgi:V/A-type H+-transporting ATPase subunit A
MGYHVAVMADSTSRWAEALREISGRLEEMPAEEGFLLIYQVAFPNSMNELVMSNTQPSIWISVYHRCVSPQGADFSEPVTQNTKRFVRAFWALDKQLAYERHYAAINWNISYSEYIPDLTAWYNDNVDSRFLRNRQELVSLLASEAKLMEIVKLIGSDVLPDEEKLIIEIGKVIRVGFLQQNAFHKEDTYVPLQKQYE